MYMHRKQAKKSTRQRVHNGVMGAFISFLPVCIFKISERNQFERGIATEVVNNTTTPHQPQPQPMGSKNVSFAVQVPRMLSDFPFICPDISSQLGKDEWQCQ